MEESVDRFKLALEILNFLLLKGDFVPTPDIQEYLFSMGFLKSPLSQSSDRRKLNRVLSFLETEGYVESERLTSRGRKPQRWRVNHSALPYLVSISDDELVSLLTFATFVPATYRNLRIFSPFLQLLCRLSKRIDPQKKELVENSFVYESQFLEKFLEFDERLLYQVYNAVIENKALRVKYKGSRSFKIHPIKIFVYNGVLYVGAVGEDKVYRTYHLSGLKILEELKDSLPMFYRRRFENVTFVIREEKPFLFGVKVALKEGMDYFPAPQIFPTQFFFKREDDGYLIYLVGFSGSRFTSRFLVEEITEILPPSEEIIKVAKNLKLKVQYNALTYGLKNNKRRFDIFIKDLSMFVKQRNALINSLRRDSSGNA